MFVTFREVSLAADDSHDIIDFAYFSGPQRDMIVREPIRWHEFDVAAMNANPPMKWASYPYLNRRVRMWNELNDATTLSDAALNYTDQFCKGNCGHHIEMCDCDEAASP